MKKTILAFLVVLVVAFAWFVPPAAADSKVDLSPKNLKGVNLAGADLRFADFNGKNLKRANLTNAKLAGATFRGANLKKANLAGAILSEFKVGTADFSDAKFCNTIMPDGSEKNDDC